MPPGRIPVVSVGSWLPQRLGTGPTHHVEVAIHRVGQLVVRKIQLIRFQHLPREFYPRAAVRFATLCT